MHGWLAYEIRFKDFCIFAVDQLIHKHLMIIMELKALLKVLDWRGCHCFSCGPSTGLPKFCHREAILLLERG